MPTDSPDCLLGVVPQQSDSRLSETTLSEVLPPTQILVLCQGIMYNIYEVDECRGLYIILIAENKYKKVTIGKEFDDNVLNARFNIWRHKYRHTRFLSHIGSPFKYILDVILQW